MIFASIATMGGAGRAFDLLSDTLYNKCVGLFLEKQEVTFVFSGES